MVLKRWMFMFLFPTVSSCRFAALCWDFFCSVDSFEPQKHQRRSSPIHTKHTFREPRALFCIVTAVDGWSQVNVCKHWPLQQRSTMRPQRPWRATLTFGYCRAEGPTSTWDVRPLQGRFSRGFDHAAVDVRPCEWAQRIASVWSLLRAERPVHLNWMHAECSRTPPFVSSSMAPGRKKILLHDHAIVWPSDKSVLYVGTVTFDMPASTFDHAYDRAPLRSILRATMYLDVRPLDDFTFDHARSRSTVGRFYA